MEQMLAMHQPVDLLYDGTKIDQGVIKGRSFTQPDMASYDIEVMKNDRSVIIANVPAKNVRLSV
jgi:hypothetical protein|tara:strand:- start:119 stop:310 length:192 start_codon:yes stop_codon:yes gene_type:complete